MSKNFVQSSLLRSIAMKGLQTKARLRLWGTGSTIFVNSIPKAGTHLLTADLERFPNVLNSHIHIENRSIPSILAGSGIDGSNPDDVAAFARYANRVRAGQFLSGHLPFHSGISEWLSGNGFKTVFVVRDPRDILVSRLHYVTKLRRHPLHDLLVSEYQSNEARLEALIIGRKSTDKWPAIQPLQPYLSQFLPWVDEPEVLTIRFEDLVGARGNGSDELRLAALARVAQHCKLDQGQAVVVARAATKKTPTLRSGKTGGWRDEMPPQVQVLLTDLCGEEIEELGYML